MISSYTLLLAMLFGLSLLRPAAAIAAVILMFGLEQWGQTSGAALAANATFTNYAIGCIVLLALATSVMRGKSLFYRMPSSYWLIIAFFAYAFISVSWSTDPQVSLAQWKKAWPYLITVIFLTPLLCARVSDIVTAHRAVILVGGFLCVAVLFFGHWGNRGLFVASAAGQVEANPLAIASVAGQVLVTAALFPIARNRMLKWAAVIVLVPVCLAVVARSGSRGQLLATLIAFALAWPLARNRAVTLRMIVAPAIVAALGFIAYLSLDYFGAAVDRWEYGNASEAAGSRAHAATMLLEVSLRNAGSTLFGLGNSASFQIVGGYPHVVPLEILGEEGLIGFGLFVAMLAVALIPAIRVLRKKSTDPTARLAATAALAALLFQLLLSFKQGSALGSCLLFMQAVLLHRVVVAMNVRKKAKVEDSVPRVAVVTPAA